MGGGPGGWKSGLEGPQAQPVTFWAESAPGRSARRPESRWPRGAHSIPHPYLPGTCQLRNHRARGATELPSCPWLPLLPLPKPLPLCSVSGLTQTWTQSRLELRAARSLDLAEPQPL